MSSVSEPRRCDSIDELLKEVQPRLKRVLAVYRVPVEDAKDLVQDSLLALVVQWDNIRDREPWLIGTLKRQCWMYWRHQRRRLCLAVDTAILEWLAEPVAPAQQRADLILDLRRVIARLPPRCRALLNARYGLGFNPTETARVLGYRESSIGKVTTRCLGALASELLAQGLVDDPPPPKIPVRPRGRR